MNPLLAFQAAAGGRARAASLSPQRRSVIARRAARLRWTKQARQYPERFWLTPRDLYDPLNAEFGFTLDTAADAGNALCARYFTKEQDALSRPWAPETCWCSPPYDEPTLARFVEKAYLESQRGALVVMLIPVRSDRPWWHDFILGTGAEERPVRGRINFIRQSDGAVRNSPVGCSVVVFRPRSGPTDVSGG